MVLSICIRGSGNKTNFINYHKYCITGHTRRQWWIGKPWKSKWINRIKRCVCLVELKEHFFLLNMLWAWMCVSEGSSGHALDKLYSILCTFKFKFLTNKKKWYHYADEQNLNFRSVNFINAHKKCRWYDYHVFHMDPKKKKRLLVLVK